ncbi:MAG: DUF2461 domain-containing protein, partial [Flavobacterium sp.]|nr:DUF2461 domain-containing protein [Flavobacterium sp.]
IRREIAFFYEDLEEILANKEFTKVFGYFDKNESNVLKNPPRGYEKEHPAIEYLKLKSFETSQKFNLEEILQPDFVAKMCQKLILLKPLNDFMNRAVTSED